METTLNLSVTQEEADLICQALILTQHLYPPSSPQRKAYESLRAKAWDWDNRRTACPVCDNSHTEGPAEAASNPDPQSPASGTPQANGPSQAFLAWGKAIEREARARDEAQAVALAWAQALASRPRLTYSWIRTAPGYPRYIQYYLDGIVLVVTPEDDENARDEVIRAMRRTNPNLTIDKALQIWKDRDER